MEVLREKKIKIDDVCALFYLLSRLRVFFVLHAERRLRRFGFKRTVTKWRSVLFTFMIDYVGFFRGPDFGGTQVCINCV